MDTISFVIKKYLNHTETFIYEPLKALKSYNAIVLTEEKRNLDLFPYPQVFSFSDLPLLQKIIPGSRKTFFKKIIMQNNARLLHAHFAWEGMDLIPLKMELGIPLVTSLYGIDVYMHTRNPIYKMQLNNLFKIGDKFLVCSDAMRKDIINGGCSKDKAILLYLGVNLDKLKYLKRMPQDREISIIMCGRFIDKKGFIYGIQAVAKLLRTNKNIKLKIIGDGPLRKYFEDYIKENNLEYNVLLLGTKSYKEYIEELLKSHIILAPSIEAASGNKEGLPMVLIEALATGIPAVATGYSGIPELVIDNKTGFTTKEKDVDQIAECLLKFIDNPVLLSEFGQNGRALVEEKFDLAKQTRKLENIYKELIK